MKMISSSPSLENIDFGRTTIVKDSILIQLTFSTSWPHNMENFANGRLVKKLRLSKIIVHVKALLNEFVKDFNKGVQ